MDTVSLHCTMFGSERVDLSKFAVEKLPIDNSANEDSFTCATIKALVCKITACNTRT